MGLRASIYALDLEWINEIAQMTLRDLLWLYSELPSAADQNFDNWLWVETSDLRIYAKPGGVFLYRGEAPGRLTRDRADQIEFLSQTVSDYLSHESAFVLESLFCGFIKYDPTGRVRPIIVESKLWWFDSVLDIIAEIHGASSAEYQGTMEIWRKIVCSSKNGDYTPESDGLVTQDEYHFPLKPPDDPDVCFGYWTTAETQLLLRVLDNIPPDTMFKLPGKDKDTVEEIRNWTTITWDGIGKLRALKSLNYERWCVVTFFGQ